MTKSSAPDIDVTILGGGIAGLSMADAVLNRGKSTALIDTKPPGSGASGAPLVLINPATGRRAKLAHNAETCIYWADELLKRTASHSGESFYKKNGVIRPALTEGLAKDFKRSPEKYNWPTTDWIHWYDEKEFSAIYPYIGKHYGGLEIPHAYTVDAATFIKNLISYQQSRGLKTCFSSDYTIQTGTTPFKIDLQSQQSFTTGIIIFAVGSAVNDSPEWEYLPTSCIKGQLLDLSFKEPLPLSHSISSMGYFAFNPDNPNRVVAGSTYEHHYDNLETDEKGNLALYKKLERTLPGFKSRDHAVLMWAGERVSMSDHNPVAGAHPELSGRYILGGLGSKGMIYGRYLAEQLSNYIFDEKPIDPELSAERFRKHY